MDGTSVHLDETKRLFFSGWADGSGKGRKTTFRFYVSVTENCYFCGVLGKSAIGARNL